MNKDTQEGDKCVKFTESQNSTSGYGRFYSYRYMKLPWDGDFANVMSSSVRNQQTFITFGTEEGRVLMHHLEKNQVVTSF